MTGLIARALIRAVRAVSDATLVAKRGALGAVAFSGSIPDSLDDGEAGAGFPIEVFNVLGAGDGFMSGLLKGWLDDEDWPTTLKFANACGAFAVSRHGCTPAYPIWEELQFFFARGIVRKDLRNDGELEQVHWATNRHGDWSQMRVFAFDHRAQLEEMESASPDRIGAFKQLCLEAALKVQHGRPGYGILCDGRLGADALSAAEGRGLWIGRPVEWPGSRPLTLEPALGPDYGGLSEWPRDQVVKVLCFCHPDDDDEMWSAQQAVVQRLFHAARRNRLEFLLEVIPSKVGLVQDDTTARIIQRFYDLGVYPDWWKLEPFKTEAAWRNAVEAIERNDARTRGIVVLGLDAPEDELAASFTLAAKFPLVKGFAVGRTIFGNVAQAWMKGHCLYLPNGANWEAVAQTDCVIAVCSAPGKGGHEARRIGPEGITLSVRGKGANTRHINNIAMENEDFCDSLLVTEVFTPPGHWSSYPSHRHDEDDFPRITYLEETYYYRLKPSDGFGIQRVYTDDGMLDETMAVRNGDVVLVPRGHHPCGAPHGLRCTT
jgi:myo-inositol catabolism protein IolC